MPTFIAVLPLRQRGGIGAVVIEMPDDFPPLSFLQAFAKAAETLSFKNAADALHLSPSALTRRIQALENQIGVALFRRLHPGLELTREGERYLESVGRVLTEMRRAHEALTPTISEPLHISALQSFTEGWLVPHRRATRLARRFAGLTIRFALAPRATAFASMSLATRAPSA